MLSVCMWMWVRLPGEPATRGATSERATTAAENSLMLMSASVAMDEMDMLLKQGGLSKIAQYERTPRKETTKPIDGMHEST